MSVKTKEFENQLKLWRVASSELKKIARKRFNKIKLFVQKNEDRLDEQTKEKLAKQICKYYTLLKNIELL